jgi:sortase (surface protein transpeptidase)
MSCPSLRKAVLIVVVAGLALAGPATASAQRLVIPRMSLDTPLMADLDHGPSLYYEDADTIAVAAHRTTHGHAFLELPTLRFGDVVRVGRRTFVVRHARIVRPWEVWVLRYRGLVLSACHPAGSSKYRYVVFAALRHTG